MNRTDQIVLKAALGGMAVVNNLFRMNPMVTAPVTAEAIIVSVGSIALDAIDYLEDEKKSKVRLSIPVEREIEREEEVWF